MTSYREALRRRLSAATPGPWIAVSDSRVEKDYTTTNARICQAETLQDSSFIAHARRDCEVLLSALEKTEAMLRGMINRSNKVTAYWRGGLVLREPALVELYDRQLEAEALERELRALLDAPEGE